MAREIQFDQIRLRRRRLLREPPIGQVSLSPHTICWDQYGVVNKLEFRRHDVAKLTWSQVETENQLSVETTDGQRHQFVGFEDGDFSSVKGFLDRNWGVLLEADWGRIKIGGAQLTWSDNPNETFKVNVAEALETEIEGGDKLRLRFPSDEDNDQASLAEVKLHIPHTVQVIHDGLMAHFATKSVRTFLRVHLLLPRGQYDLGFNLTYLRLLGKTDSMKITHGRVVKMSFLPTPQGTTVFALITVYPPVVLRGGTKYPHLVLQGAVGGGLMKRLESEFPEKLKRGGTRGLIAQLRGEDGFLYLMPGGICFLPRPSTILPYTEMKSSHVKEIANDEANYNLVIKMKSGRKEKLIVERKETHGILKYLDEKRVKLVNVANDLAKWEAELEDMNDQGAPNGSVEEKMEFEQKMQKLQENIQDTLEEFPGQTQI